MKLSSVVWMTCAVALLGTIGAAAVSGADGKDKIAGSLAIFAPSTAPAGSISLILNDGKAPVTVAVSDSTEIAGICHDCGLLQKFKASESPKHCAMCGCDSPNAQCVAWVPLKHNTSDEMFKALPVGIALRVTFNEPDKPASGLKTLTIDRHEVMLPVDGLADKTADQLVTLGKSAGASKTELLPGGKLLVMGVKDEWSPAAEAKFEKALAAMGAKVAFPVTEAK